VTRKVPRKSIYCGYINKNGSFCVEI